MGYDATIPDPLAMRGATWSWAVTTGPSGGDWGHSVTRSNGGWSSSAQSGTLPFGDSAGAEPVGVSFGFGMGDRHGHDGECVRVELTLTPVAPPSPSPSPSAEPSPTPSAMPTTAPTATPPPGGWNGGGTGDTSHLEGCSFDGNPLNAPAFTGCVVSHLPGQIADAVVGDMGPVNAAAAQIGTDLTGKFSGLTDSLAGVGGALSGTSANGGGDSGLSFTLPWFDASIGGTHDVALELPTLTNPFRGALVALIWLLAGIAGVRLVSRIAGVGGGDE